MNAANNVADAASSGLTFFDIMVLLSLVIAMATGFIRGFVTSVIDSFSSIGAIAFTLVAHPLFAKLTHSFMDSGSAADIVALVGGFVIGVVLLKLTAVALGDRIKASFAGMLDRSLGALFGLFTATFFICFAYMCVAYVIPDRFMPKTVTEARFKPLVAYGANWLARATPKLIEKVKRNAGTGNLLAEMRSVAPGKDTTPGIDPDEAGGYVPADRARLEDKLNEIMGEPEAPETPAANVSTEDRIGGLLNSMDDAEGRTAPQG